MDGKINVVKTFLLKWKNKYKYKMNKPLCVSTHKGIYLQSDLVLTHKFKLLVAFCNFKIYKVNYQNYFNEPSTQYSKISTMFQIGLERDSVNLKDHSVLFFLIDAGRKSWCVL